MAELSTSRVAVPLGRVQGTLAFAEFTLLRAQQAAMRQYEAAAAAEFCGDLVETYALPDWLPPVHTWLPHADLAALGLEQNPQHQPEMVGTCGVDSHVDNIHGLVFVAVLYNDGLRFNQGRQSHVTAPGQWFVFDDGLPHQVTDTPKTTCYLCVTVPLKRQEAECR